MEYDALIMMAAIIAYGAFEYRRRERRHGEALVYLRQGIAPPSGAPRAWRLVTTGFVGFLLVGAGAVLALRGVMMPRYGSGLAVIGGIFLLIALPVLWMLFRDYRAYRDQRFLN
jgi:hypothetical protein